MCAFFSLELVEILQAVAVMGLFTNEGFLFLSVYVSPWYNHTGWLGVKTPIYLLCVCIETV